MKLTTQLTALALALTGAIGGAQATVLIIDTPTTSVDVSGSFFGGTLVASAITDISNLSYQGIARTAVYDTGTGLDFYYQFSNASTSKNGVERFTGWDFSALGSGAVSVFQTNAAFGAFTSGTEPSDYADRTALGVIGFNFVADAGSKINPGKTSFVQVIRTNARHYQPGNFGLLNGIGDNAPGFAVSAVPEPESYAMMLAGLCLMGTIARRRKSKQA
ncbi:PEP-CTERM sorting domain-containing protein [Rhodoferax sp. AJA081-3]|uniref:PEP-CTERM sorting domain-containing protein n=1 Tax=Rhodoferax sp. AJA081-3 TaxID=2752316 RepID=UPI001ADEC19D|nr:PEP-CTERM sorting domain-containing protein [Rhodoferax sp. AJA081-3]QTN29355.1 PEP-CTERM sorting domain-containing protein [Rhodoferax sp. AJA081-3]